VEKTKVVSVRLANESLHLQARIYAMTHGMTFGKLVSIALTEYLARNTRTSPTLKSPEARRRKPGPEKA
jgi:hypothetical protein